MSRLLLPQNSINMYLVGKYCRKGQSCGDSTKATRSTVAEGTAPDTDLY